MTQVSNRTVLGLQSQDLKVQNNSQQFLFNSTWQRSQATRMCRRSVRRRPIVTMAEWQTWNASPTMLRRRRSNSIWATWVWLGQPNIPLCLDRLLNPNSSHSGCQPVRGEARKGCRGATSQTAGAAKGADIEGGRRHNRQRIACVPDCSRADITGTPRGCGGSARGAHGIN